MKKLIATSSYALLALVALAACAALYIHVAGIPHYTPRQIAIAVDVTPERVARGRRTAVLLCAECHQDPATGALTGKRMSEGGRFGEILSQNITQDEELGIGRWSDGEIAYLIRTGVARDGRYTPPWMVKLPLLSDEDLKDVIAFLRSDDPMVEPRHVPDRPSRPSFFTKLMTHVAWKPLPYPDAPVVAPAPSDKVAYGRYLTVAKLECHGCHSKDFAKLDLLVPERSGGFLGGGNPFRDDQHRRVYSANLTPDPTGLGSWTEEQFQRTLKLGLRPDGRPLRAPMRARPELTDEELSAIWAYLRSVPKIAHAVPAAEGGARPATADAGRTIYYKYGCNSCHGDAGVGTYDLRKGASRFASDADLIAYIKHPERTRPGIPMPTWDGTIEEHEYAPLARFVRALGQASSAGTPEAARSTLD